MLAAIAAVLGAGFAGAVGSFFVMLWWDSYVLHDHDGQAGIVYAILALFIGAACALLVLILIAVRAWKHYSAPEPDRPTSRVVE